MLAFCAKQLGTMLYGFFKVVEDLSERDEIARLQKISAEFQLDSLIRPNVFYAYECKWSDTKVDMENGWRRLVGQKCCMNNSAMVVVEIGRGTCWGFRGCAAG